MYDVNLVTTNIKEGIFMQNTLEKILLVGLVYGTSQNHKFVDVNVQITIDYSCL